MRPPFSVLARRVNSFAELHAHTRFGWLEARIIEGLVRRHSARVALKSTLYVVTLILMLLGTLIILTFDPTKGHSAIVGGLVK